MGCDNVFELEKAVAARGKYLKDIRSWNREQEFAKAKSITLEQFKVYATYLSNALYIPL